MIASILAIISKIPGMIQIIRELTIEVGRWLLEQDRKERRRKLEEGLKEAEKKKDTSNVEDIFRKP